MEHPETETAPVASPRTYPDRDEFENRRRIILTGVAHGGLDKWRRGYFEGGDPGKYLPGHAMARLLLHPDDHEVRQYMNDDRSYKEHYHFAAVNWARFLPLFGDTVLTETTRQELAETAFRYDSYLSPRGTENHKVMWWSSANVLPHYLAGNGGLSHRDRETTLSAAKQQLRDYVKGLFLAGQGEWDSSTYLMFDINALLNIYDFSPDFESRLLAKAALDYLVAGYAMKYTDGVYCAPNQRGFASGPHTSIADQTGYLWWGSHRQVSSEDTQGFRYAIHAATSAWRPNTVICNLAQRKMRRLPVEQRNSKANYWHGRGIDPQPGNTHESVYIDEHFTMGSLWDGHGSQHTRFMIVLETPEGGVTVTGGHPRCSDHNGRKTGIGFRDGNGRYVQSVQVGPSYLCMAQAPEDEEHDYTFLSIPECIKVENTGAWHTMAIGESVIAVRPLAGQAVLATVPDKKDRTMSIVKFPGRKSGFLVWVGARITRERLEDVEFDGSAYLVEGTVRYRLPGGPAVVATFSPAPDSDTHGNCAAHATIDGGPVELARWPIYSGPFLRQEEEIVTVRDGKDHFTIDFSGDLPRYR